MGLRGPLPTPDGVKRALGNPGKRRLNDHATPPAFAPAMPESLSEGAKAEWAALVPVLIATGHIAETDGPMIAEMCEIKARLVSVRSAIVGAMAKLKETGSGADAIRALLVNDAKGGVIVNPLCDEERRLQAQLIQMYRMFGLDPYSRNRMPPAPKSEADPVDAGTCPPPPQSVQ